MRIVKGETPEYDSYEVLVPAPSNWLARLLKFPAGEVKLKFVLEADDESGRVTRQLCDDNGSPVFTNGSEDISYSNSVKLLLLMPPLKLEFLKAGFAPKTITTYEKGLKIVNRNPTVSIAMQIQESAETSELESVKM